jgi:hypothetical protein
MKTALDLCITKISFPGCDAKIKEGVLVGPQIRELLQDVTFEDQPGEEEKAAWKSFKNVASYCLANQTAEHCRNMVADLVQFYRSMVCHT